MNIRKYRKKNRLNQQQLASLLGVSQGYLSDIERGARDVPKKMALDLHAMDRKYFDLAKLLTEPQVAD